MGLVSGAAIVEEVNDIKYLYCLQLEITSTNIGRKVVLHKKVTTSIVILPSGKLCRDSFSLRKYPSQWTGGYTYHKQFHCH